MLRLDNPDFVGDLAPWHGNTFRVTWRYKFYGDDYVTFDVDALGQSTRLAIRNWLHFERVQPANKGAQ